MCEGPTTQKARTPSSAFASELVICGLLMGLALGNLLSTFEFRSHSLGHYLLGGALVIVSVWYIHLLNVWKNLPAPRPLDDTLEPSVLSGLICLGGVAFAYWYDLARNPDFYGASGDPRTPA